MSVDINDAIRTIVEGMTDEQRDDLTKKLYDAAEGVMQAVSERAPYLILKQNAKEVSAFARSIMEGGER